MNVFDYVYSNNIDKLKEYLEFGDVNVLNERGMSLLHYSVIFNNHEIFDLLLDNYINVNICDAHGDTALHYCVINNRTGFLKALIRNNAIVDVRNNDGQTPLYKACALGRENLVELLLEYTSLNLSVKDDKNETIFMSLIRSRNMNLIRKYNIDETLINTPNYIGETPLHIASKVGDVNVIKFLLENKAFVNAKNKTGETPLFYAVQGLNLEVISLLLKYGAVLDCKSTFGDTIYSMIPTYELSSYINDKSEQYKSYLYHSNYPLHYAIIIENIELVRKYAVIRNINHKDNFGYTPIELARLINNPKISLIIDEEKRRLDRNIDLF